MLTASQKAHNFLTEETQFHLGFLPTEQSSPLTVTLEDDFRHDAAKGVATLQKVDRNVLEMAKKMFRSDAYRTLAETLLSTLISGGRIVFSGCGATGRLAILLESMWRTACRDLQGIYPALKPYADHVFSIMTGGDFALVKSVEFFEDYAVFGRRQVREMDLGAADTLVAITEGGETSSVLGTAAETLERGGKVFLLFNNPADLLAGHLERSRAIIRDPRVTVLDLSCGPMALAGSTRMQATTSEQLIAGAALESAFLKLAGLPVPDYAEDFEKLLCTLESDAVRRAASAYIDFEAGVYRRGGKITYYTGNFLLDVFTDTTERSPTFMLPPFRAWDDPVSAQSPAFVKSPFYATEEAWLQAMARPLRCLEWTMADYREMGVADRISSAPEIAARNLLKFRIGNEAAPERAQNVADAAVVVAVGDEASDPDYSARARTAAKDFPCVKTFAIDGVNGDFSTGLLSCRSTPLALMEHLAVKLILNTISTGVMTAVGRVSGNWMSFVSLSNKKLIDRGIRLVAELGKLSYEDACLRIFEAMEDADKQQRPGQERICAVQLALQKLRGGKS